MKNCLLLVLTLLSVIVFSSCSPKKFDCVAPTENCQYGTACRDGKCGVHEYDDVDDIFENRIRS